MELAPYNYPIYGENFKRNFVNPNLAGSQGCDLLENEWFQYSGVVDISACVDIGSVIIYKKTLENLRKS